MKTRRTNKRLLLKTIRRSRNPDKKYDAIFQYPDGHTKTTSFGQTGYNDFVKYNSKFGTDVAKKHKTRYIKRHRGMGETFRNPVKPQTLSRYILWNKPSLRDSIKDFKRRFSL